MASVTRLLGVLALCVSVSDASAQMSYRRSHGFDIRVGNTVRVEIADPSARKESLRKRCPLMDSWANGFAELF
jgi:hypothetical protein